MAKHLHKKFSDEHVRPLQLSLSTQPHSEYRTNRLGRALGKVELLLITPYPFLYGAYR